MSDEPMVPEAEPKPAKPKKERRIPVAVVRQTGLAVLVEYAEDGAPVRVTLPAESIREGTVAQADLEAGVPYGLPWERFSLAAPKGGDVARALRNAGIWTADDLRSRPQRAISALQSVFRSDLAALNRFAAEAAKESEE